jgi:hypothetical protein
MITESGTSCHGSDYTKFWLTNAVTDAESWIAPANEAGEGAANAGLLITAPFPFTFRGNGQ